ncbi:hypothetical protein [Steroidobacter sp.]|uniref:hypothetical protein n=1 Tax=Steroidobacter sp. TaxID=1978227 RepID=UPI001A40827A|nr:hypothetical protein [Steroidobacter sp.]MBL8270649.1 hypothetical protein [Steroidobacter sp.]
MTSRARNRGGAAWSLVKLLLLLAVVSVLFGAGGSCVKQVPELAGKAAAEIAGGVASAAGDAAGNAWNRNVAWPVKRTWNRFTNWLSDLFSLGRDFWDNSSPGEKFKLVCENAPVQGLSEICKYFEAPLSAASDAQTERIACLWQAAARSGSGEAMRIANVCVVNKNDPSALESCLQRQIEPGEGASCLASAPGQFWKQAAQTFKPLACPEVTDGVAMPGTPSSCGSAAATTTTPAADPSTARIDQPYVNCLRSVYDRQIAGRLPSQQSCLDQQQPSMQHWVRCLEGVLVQRLPSSGATAVAQCGNVR